MLVLPGIAVPMVGAVGSVTGGAGAMTMPTPESRSMPAASMLSAELSSAVVIWALLKAGFADLINAAMAAAVGAAAEVPQKGFSPPFSGSIVEPQSDAARSTLAKVVPPLVANRTFPGVMAVPLGL